METKICGRCGIQKPVDDFGFRDVKLGIRHSWCKSCFVEYKRVWYELNGERHRAHAKERRALAEDENQRRMWEYLATHPCVDCGERDPVVLHFDHQRDKRRDVSFMCSSGGAWSTILEEIANSGALIAMPERRRANAG